MLLASPGPALSQGLLCLKALLFPHVLLLVCVVYGGHKTLLKAGQQQPGVCSERDVEVSPVLQKCWEHGRLSLGQVPLLPVRWAETGMGMYCPVGKVTPAASGESGPE